jgi:hypothetical protein
MDVVVSSVDYNPPELAEQVPFEFALLRVLPGPDRPDYWLGALHRPMRWIDDNVEKSVEHVIICARWAGTQIEAGFANLPIGIAYVIDPSLLNEPHLSFEKCQYVAIGIASDVSGGRPPPELTDILSGNIARAFGIGKRG